MGGCSLSFVSIDKGERMRAFQFCANRTKCRSNVFDGAQVLLNRRACQLMAAHGVSKSGDPKMVGVPCLPFGNQPQMGFPFQINHRKSALFLEIPV